MNSPKRSALGILLAIATSVAIGVTPAVAAGDAPPGWVLQENVNLADSSRWTAETGQAANTSSYDLPSNVTFSKSAITVHAAPKAIGMAKYTSGDAKGTGIRIPNYARVEVTGTVPFGAGLWPALMWLRPLDSSNGEIDLMEVFGPDARVAATIHNEYGANHKPMQGSIRWASMPVSGPAVTHTYVMEKTPNRIRVTVDDVPILDAGPQDVRPGFDWRKIFERPSATWYPRVTLQVGCAPSAPKCGIGVPGPGWKGSDVKLTSLRIWRLSGSPSTSAAARPATAGSFTLVPAREERYLVAPTRKTASAVVSFTVPKNIGSGTLYQSLQLPVAGQAGSGFRATVALKSSGSIYLTLASVNGKTTQIYTERLVTKHGSYSAGDSVRVAIAVQSGSVSAKAWSPAHSRDPGWQVSAATKVSPSTLSGVLVIGYLSKIGPTLLRAPWQVVSS